MKKENKCLTGKRKGIWYMIVKSNTKKDWSFVILTDGNYTKGFNLTLPVSKARKFVNTMIGIFIREVKKQNEEKHRGLF